MSDVWDNELLLLWCWIQYVRRCCCCFARVDCDSWQLSLLLDSWRSSVRLSCPGSWDSWCSFRLLLLLLLLLRVAWDSRRSFRSVPFRSVPFATTAAASYLREIRGVRSVYCCFCCFQFVQLDFESLLYSFIICILAFAKKKVILKSTIKITNIRWAHFSFRTVHRALRLTDDGFGWILKKEEKNIELSRKFVWVIIVVFYTKDFHARRRWIHEFVKRGIKCNKNELF